MGKKFSKSLSPKIVLCALDDRDFAVLPARLGNAEGIDIALVLCGYRVPSRYSRWAEFISDT